MTVLKKHVTPEGQARDCSAEVRCRYGASAPHFYYDTTIKQEVLNPAHPTQKVIDNVPAEEILEKADSLLPSDVTPTRQQEYDEARYVLLKRTETFNKKREHIINSYSEKHRDTLRALTNSPEGAGSIATFEIFDPEENDGAAKSIATDDEKYAFAKAYLDKNKAEGKLRALISAAHVK